MKRRSKKKKFLYRTSIYFILLSIMFMGVVYATINSYISKGELNDDGIINYADVNLLQLHLIHEQ